MPKSGWDGSEMPGGRKYSASLHRIKETKAAGKRRGKDDDTFRLSNLNEQFQARYPLFDLYTNGIGEAQLVPRLSVIASLEERLACDTDWRTNLKLWNDTKEAIHAEIKKMYTDGILAELPSGLFTVLSMSQGRVENIEKLMVSLPVKDLDFSQLNTAKQPLSPILAKERANVADLLGYLNAVVSSTYPGCKQAVTYVASEAVAEGEPKLPPHFKIEVSRPQAAMASMDEPDMLLPELQRIFSDGKTPANELATGPDLAPDMGRSAEYALVGNPEILLKLAQRNDPQHAPKKTKSIG